MLDYEDSWLSKRLQLFVQQGEVRLKIYHSFLTMAMSNSQPHSRWLHHLQTHNGNAGRNSKRLQRSSGKHLVVRTKEIVPGSFLFGGESHPRSNLEYFRKKKTVLVWKKLQWSLRTQRRFNRKSSPET